MVTELEPSSNHQTAHVRDTTQHRPGQEQAASPPTLTGKVGREAPGGGTEQVATPPASYGRTLARSQPNLGTGRKWDILPN